MILELEHYYMDDTVNYLDLKTHKLHVPKIPADNVMLLDDIHIENTSNVFNPLEFKSESEKIYNANIDIYFESHMIEYAESIIKALVKNHNTGLKKEYFRKQNKYVFFIETNNKKIALFEVLDSVINYYCVTLSLTWLVYKLSDFKYENMIKNITSMELISVQDNLTILNQKYKKVEENVLDLLYIVNPYLTEKIKYKFI